MTPRSPAFAIWDRVEWPATITPKKAVRNRGTISKIVDCSRFEMCRSCQWHYRGGYCYEILVDGADHYTLIQSEENITPLCLLDRIVEALK